MASKRKALCVNEKVGLIRAIEKGEKKSDVGRRLGLSPSTIATIWKNKEAIIQAELQGRSTKKLRKPKFKNLDQAMFLWFNNQHQHNVPISGPTIKAKAEKFAKQLGITDFKASEGWLGKFKHRHNITFGKMNGETRDVDMNVTNDWSKNMWPKLMDKYSPNDIFNADETGLFFKMTPDKTFKFKGEKCVGGNLSEQRITILVAANMSGTEKRKLLVIGKSKNPQCFKNIKHLPVTYKANKSAWMTSQFFEEEVRNWDAELKERKILLLVDNCPAHPLITNLRNIELAFFPANTTSILPPMERMVIKSLKGHYRRKLLMELIETDGKTSINMLQAVNFLSKAWKEVTAATIQHSFRHARLCNSQIVETEQFDSEDNLPLSDWIKQFSIQSCNSLIVKTEQFDSMDNLPLSDWIKQFSIQSCNSLTVKTEQFDSEDNQPLSDWIKQFSIQPNRFSKDLQTYENIDQNLATTASLTDEYIIESVSKIKEDPNEDNEDDQGENSEPSPTVQQALDAAKLIEKFLLFHEDDPSTSEDMHKILKKIQNKYWHSKKRQAKFTE